MIGSPLTAIYSDLIVALAAQHRLPAVYPFRYFATRGGLISYGPDLHRALPASGRLRRSHPQGRAADEPSGQAPAKYDLVINLKTAKSLDLRVPPSLLARADEVIEETLANDRLWHLTDVSRWARACPL